MTRAFCPLDFAVLFSHLPNFTPIIFNSERQQKKCNICSDFRSEFPIAGLKRKPNTYSVYGKGIRAFRLKPGAYELIKDTKGSQTASEKLRNDFPVLCRNLLGRFEVVLCGGNPGK